MIVDALILPSLGLWLCLHFVKYLVDSRDKGNSSLPLTRTRPVPLRSSPLAQWMARLRSETLFTLRDVRLDISTTALNNPLEMLSSRLRQHYFLHNTIRVLYNIGATVSALATVASVPILAFVIWSMILPLHADHTAPLRAKRSTDSDIKTTHHPGRAVQLVVGLPPYYFLSLIVDFA